MDYKRELLDKLASFEARCELMLVGAPCLAAGNSLHAVVFLSVTQALDGLGHAVYFI